MNNPIRVSPDAAQRAVDMLPIYGWIPCAAAAQTEANPRRWSYGLGREPVGDFRPLFTPGRENFRVIYRHLEFGVDGLFLWLPYGNPSTNRFQSFDAWLTLPPDAKKNIHDSLRLLDDEVQRRGLTQRTIMYFGSIRGESFAEARRERFAPGQNDIDEEAAWRRLLACLGPALELDCDIAIDNTGRAQDNPLHQRLLGRLHDLLYRQGRKLYAEATVEKANTHQHGWPSVETEQAHIEKDRKTKK